MSNYRKKGYNYKMNSSENKQVTYMRFLFINNFYYFSVPGNTLHPPLMYVSVKSVCTFFLFENGFYCNFE